MAYSKFLFSLFLFVLLLQTIPSSSRYIHIDYPLDDSFGNSSFVSRPRNYHNLYSDPLFQALYEAGYRQMSRIVPRKIIPAVRSHFGHDVAINIFAPSDQEIDFYTDDMKFLQQVVPMRLDREALKNFPRNSIIPSFHPLEHLEVTQPLDGGSGEDFSINGVSIKDWEIYDDGLVVVHGVPHLFNDWWKDVKKTQVVDESFSEL